MTDKFPNLPSDELAMLATVEAASQAGQYTVIEEPPPTHDHAKRLAALKLLVAKGWIVGGFFEPEWIDGEPFKRGAYVFWSEDITTFHAEGLVSRMPL